jgi:hypothetical protein
MLPRLSAVSDPKAGRPRGVVRRETARNRESRHRSGPSAEHRTIHGAHAVDGSGVRSRRCLNQSILYVARLNLAFVLHAPTSAISWPGNFGKAVFFTHRYFMTTSKRPGGYAAGPDRVRGWGQGREKGTPISDCGMGQMPKDQGSTEAHRSLPRILVRRWPGITRRGLRVLPVE